MRSTTHQEALQEMSKPQPKMQLPFGASLLQVKHWECDRKGRAGAWICTKFPSGSKKKNGWKETGKAVKQRFFIMHFWQQILLKTSCLKCIFSDTSHQDCCCFLQGWWLYMPLKSLFKKTSSPWPPGLSKATHISWHRWFLKLQDGIRIGIPLDELEISVATHQNALCHSDRKTFKIGEQDAKRTPNPS